MSNPSAGHAPMLAVYDLKKEYDSPAGLLPVLKGVHFSLSPGQTAFIVGRSGSGKSTFLHLMAGLDQPSSGKIIFEGEDITQMKERALCRMRNQRVGIVFQFYHLLPELTVYENVLLPSMIRGRKDEKWAKEVLNRVKLSSRQEHYPSELSGGEQQRAAIARALVNRPAVVYCDEPTGNLDRETAQSIMGLIHDLSRRDGQAFVIVTHDEAMAWQYQNVWRMVEGVLVREEPGQVGVEQSQS